jgi:membrane dipeptidase
MSTTRRHFLGGAAALAGAPLLASLPGCAANARSSGEAEVAPSAPSAVLAVDMHNHFYPEGTEPHPQRGPGPGRPPEPAGPSLLVANELRRSGLTAICASYVIDFAHNEKPGDARANLLRWLTAVDGELEKGRLRRALSLRDLEDARGSGTPTIIQSVEGAHFIEGDLARVEEVYGRGLRHLQLLHEKDDLVSPLGDTNSGVAHLGGLTPFGAQVVKECDRLGILVDLAHCSHETVLAVLKITSRPVIVSHTNLDTWSGADPRMAQMMRPRLISREHAKVIADAGGVIGVWTHLTASLPELVESVKAMVDAVGVDHVGIGSDTDLLSARVGHGTNVAWPGLTGGFWNQVAEEMRRQGFHPDEIARVGGGNYCRVFGSATGAPG